MRPSFHCFVVCLLFMTDMTRWYLASCAMVVLCSAFEIVGFPASDKAMRVFWFYRLKCKVRFEIALSKALGLSEESRQLTGSRTNLLFHLNLCSLQ